MAKYQGFIVFISCLILLIICILISQNQMLERRRKVKFIVSFSLIGILSVLELIGLLADGHGGFCRVLNYASNLLGFIISPMVPLFFAISVYKLNRKCLIATGISTVIYFIVVIVLTIFGQLFTINDQNVYERGNLFFIHVIAYTITMIMLFITVIIAANNYELRNKIVVYLLFIAFSIGFYVQVVLPSMYLKQFTLLLVSIVFYTFFNQLWQQKDGLTGLFTQHCYLKKLDIISKDCTIMMLDIDDFKGVNDNYGHEIGDQCLIIVSRCIQSVFSKYGACYRIGGDEFSIILSEQANPAKLTNALNSKLDIEREKNKWLPYISVGWAEYTKGDNVLEVKDKADMKMYYYKEYRKNNANYYKSDK